MNVDKPSPFTLATLREKSRWLERFARNVHSQTGEDGLLAKALEIIGSDSRLCVDVGAWDGLKGSNTRELIISGWESIQIEGNPERFIQLTHLYADIPRVRCVRRFVQPTGPDSLDAILDGCSVPAEFGLLCIDIDGNDWHVWKSLGRRPHLVLIEYNFSVPDEVSFVQPSDPRIAQGASLRAFVELGRKMEYELIFATGLNALFVAREFYPLFCIPDNSLEVMHVPCSNARTHVFFGYDGTVFVRGSARAPWHDLPILEHRVQILPRALRKAGGYNRWQILWFLTVRACLDGNLLRPRKWLTALRVLFGRQVVTNVPRS
jgi:hypothetical protein